MDTIFALASAPGKAGISVIRISGSAAISVVEKITKSKLNGPTPKLRVIYDLDDSIIDQALVLTFQAPNSFTGENVAELHLHGSTAVVSLTVNILNNIRGLRLAEAGEFTKLAFQNGKINLLKAESIADLISAETEIQRKQAIKIMRGKSSAKFN